jgi:hypothetical protein
VKWTDREEALVDRRAPDREQGVRRAGGRRGAVVAASAEPGVHARGITAPARAGAGDRAGRGGHVGHAPSGDLASAAQAARGPAALLAQLDLEVYAGFQGAWQWRLGFGRPSSRLTLRQPPIAP